MHATKRELILAALFLISLPLICELVLRAAHVRVAPDFSVADAQTGWRRRPFAEGWSLEESEQYVKFNSHGFRDHEHAYVKPPNTYRIAILGNSWTEALQLPLQKTYSSQLEEKLNVSRCYAPKKIEVMNFGLSGYSNAQELLLLKYEVSKYSPDLVLLGFYSARDVPNNIRELNSIGDPRTVPYFIYRGDHLELDTTFRSFLPKSGAQQRLKQVRDALQKHFLALQWAHNFISRQRARIAALATDDSTNSLGVSDLEYAVYKAPTEPVMKRAWKITELLLLAMRDEAQRQGAEFRIVVLANRPQVDPNESRRIALMKSLGVSDFSYADQRIRSLADQHHIPVTLLAPSLSSYASEHHVYLNGFNETNLGTGHWNETGHRLAAAVIATDLCGSAGTKRSNNLLAHRANN